MINSLIQWWLTPKFPQKHIDNLLRYKPIGIKNIVRNYYRTWVVHPFKRRFSKFYLYILKTFFGLKVIGITGSSGKTTTKEMLASILGLDGKTVYSYANIDPIYNIPTTVLKCTPNTKYLILEMGVEYPNEMDFYLWLAKPDISVITNVFPTHIKYLKNIDGVYREKSKIVRYLSKNSTAVINSEDLYLRKLKNKVNVNIFWFGNGSDVYASGLKINSNFKTEFVLNWYGKSTNIEIPIIGEQFVSDALASITVAFNLKIEIDKIKLGLIKFKSADHRMVVKKLKSGAVLIDDSYNNNPESAKKAITTLKAVAGKRKTILIFGDMLELGRDEIKYHKEIGAHISNVGIDRVIPIGNLSRYVTKDRKIAFSVWQEAMPIIKTFVKRGNIIMVKGSRGLKLDEVVKNLV